MWLALVFLSAFLLGCYEVNKKMSLNGNAVIPILFFNTLINGLTSVPFILLSFYMDCLDGTMVYIPRASLEDHLKVLIRAATVLSSWIPGYFTLKHLPLTITGSIRASQPVLTLLGATLLFRERLNLFQWVGVLLSIASFHLPSLLGKEEGIHLAHNKWAFLTVLFILTGVMSGLYDEHLTRSMGITAAQVWFNAYQCVIISFTLLSLWYPNRKKSTLSQWRWNIISISAFLCAANWVYFCTLTFPDPMIPIVSMVRRSNILMASLAGAIFFYERNLKNRVIDLLPMLLGMILLCLGTK